METRYTGQRVTVMGLGHFGGGVAAARWLVQQGAHVTVIDLADDDTLRDALARLDGLPLEAIHLGAHREEDFRRADLVIVNPAVRPGNRLVEVARSHGAQITTELGLVLEHCPARMIGVTGSNGKSTTAAMIDAILAADARATWLGGNLGGSLLDRLEGIQPDDWVVLEISSFQLAWLPPSTRVPEVAAITNCTPNHLDWHRDWSDYVTTKQSLLMRQTPDDSAVLNQHDDEVARWQPYARGRVIGAVEMREVPALKLPGDHNRINAACAMAAARAVGCHRAAELRGLIGFGGLASRLDRVATIGGISLYDDSAATTPESTRAALEALNTPTWMLIGGKDKGLDLGNLAAELVRRARGAAFYGAAADTLSGSCRAIDARFNHAMVATLDAALHWCWQQAEPGDAIVLSPACSSHDQFTNYRARSEHFRAAVRVLADRYNR